MSDIDKKRSELALKASHEGIWKWSYTTGDIYYSDLMLELMGCADQASAPHLFEKMDSIFHKDDHRDVQSTLDAFLKTTGEETFGTECRYLHKDGNVRWFRIRGACHRDENGKPTVIAGTIIDITQRREAELKLAEEKHLINLLTESIPVNIYFKDEDSKFVMTNSATAQKMGFDHIEDIIGKSDHDFFDARHANKSRQDEVNIMETGEILIGSLEQEFWDKNKETWCITSKYPWRDHHGKIKGTFGVTNDVSEIVGAQNRLVEVADIYKKRNAVYEAELKLAEEIQQAILVKKIPSLPREATKDSIFSASFDITHIPMHGLAGDFYEAIPISDTQMGILLCDVMGHGIRAGLIVAMIRGLITKEKQHAASPEKFITNLNKDLSHILNKAGISIFSTAIYCVVDTAKNTLSMANAGHPLPILRKDSIYSLMTPTLCKPGHYVTAPALGLIANSAYQTTVVPLDDLEEIIFYTDGIYEVANAEDEELGVMNLIAAMNLEKVKSESSIKKLIKTARNYARGNQFNDDVCLVSMSIS